LWAVAGKRNKREKERVGRGERREDGLGRAVGLGLFVFFFFCLFFSFFSTHNNQKQNQQK
jgi:preprotein translocase subunit SecG